MELFTLASCVTTFFIVYAVFKIKADMARRNLILKRISKSGAPPSLPFIGSAHLLVGSTEVIMNRMIETFNAYSSPIPLWIGNHLAVVVTAPEHVKAVCRSDKAIGKSAFLNFAESFVGTGIFTAPAAKWRIHRPLIQPSFTLKNLQSFVGIFAANAVSVVNDMEQHSGGPEFEILHPHVSKYSLSTTCDTTMGVNLMEQLELRDHYGKMIEEVLSSLIERIFYIWLHPDFIFYRTRLGKTHRKCVEYLNDVTDNVIRTRRKEHLERRSQPDAADDKGHYEPRRTTLLDHLLVLSYNHKTLSEKALRDELNTVIIAGYDTLAVTTCFAMLSLACNPEIQDKVYQELCEIYGEDDNQEFVVTPKDLTRMQYLGRVVKETLRLFPTAPIVIRAAVEDFDIDGITVPKGSSVALGLVDLHRNEKYWPDPMKFDPDRFLPDEVAKRHPFAYLPFGGGIRSCIGMKYAMMSMKTLLATVIRRYVLIKDDITPVKDIPLKFDFLLRTSDPITLRIERRSIPNNTPN